MPVVTLNSAIYRSGLGKEVQLWSLSALPQQSDFVRWDRAT